MDIEIELLDFGDDDIAYGAELPISPHGHGQFVAPDSSDSSKQLMVELKDQWEVLWPEILLEMQSNAAEFDVELGLGSGQLMGSVQRLDETVFMGDQADLMIGIRPHETAVPEWNFFIRNSTIVHCQPVY